MKIYNFEDFKNVLVMGDIHGEFKTLLYNLKIINNKNYNLSNDIDREFNYKRNGYTKKYRLPKLNKTILIIAGDCGFGFNKDIYYQTELVKLNTFLSECESHIIFIRGNHDDPRFFNENVLDFTNIHCVPDYSIIKTQNLTTLCVGGGLSVDRIWRKQQEARINKHNNSNPKKLYWEDEMPIFDKTKLDEIIKSEIKIDSIVTHTSPSFTSPKIKESAIGWIKQDPNLKKDIKAERKVMDDIFNYFDEGKDIKFWAYGHFHINDIKKHYGVLFFAIDDEMNIIDPLSELEKYDKKTKGLDEKGITPDFFDFLTLDTLSDMPSHNDVIDVADDGNHNIHLDIIQRNINNERERHHERNVDDDFEPF